MPRRPHWFPVSHDINSDPEVIALTDKFGLAGLKVWLEILSIADRNEGIFATDWSIKRALAIKCNTTQRQVSGMLEFIETRSWITCELPAKVNNYANYHRTREPKRHKIGSLPDQTRPEDKEKKLNKEKKVHFSNGEFMPEYWKNRLKDQLKPVPKAGSLKEILDRDFKKP